MAEQREGAPLRLALMWTLQTQFTGYILAKADAMPSLELIPRRAGRGPIQEMVEGEADLAVTSPMHLLAAGEKAADLVLIALFMSRSPVRLTGLRERVGERIDAERGYRVGVWSGEDTELRAMLRLSGVDLNRVEFVPVGEGVQELISGEVDFVQATTYNELPAIVAAAGSADAVVAHDPAAWQVDVAKDGLVVRRDLLAERPADIAALLAAVCDGWRTALTDPAAAAVRVCELVPDLNLAEQTQQLERLLGLFDPSRQLGEPLALELERAVVCARAAGSEVDSAGVEIDQRPWRQATAAEPGGA